MEEIHGDLRRNNDVRLREEVNAAFGINKTGNNNNTGTIPPMGESLYFIIDGEKNTSL